MARKNVQIADWFVEHEEKFRAVLTYMVSLLQTKCSDLGISPAVAPEFRIKEEYKLKSKFARKKYSKIKEFTDYAGCRFLFKKQHDANFFFDDLNSDPKFQVDKKNTIDKRLLYDPDQFGYISHHAVVSLAVFPSELKTEFPHISFEDSPQNYKVEIQIRTLLQHVWAIISRQLIYDKIENVPFKLRKKFFRLEAMFEAIDDEIEQLFADYYQSSTIFDDTIFLRQNINLNNLKKYLELQIDSNILVIEKLPSWILDLKAVGINTIGALHKLLNDFYNNFYFIYKGKISELMITYKANVSIDDFCGFPGWMIDAIIWHNPENYMINFNKNIEDGIKRSDQFGHPQLTEKYIRWLIDSNFSHQIFQ
ncbi:MAG: hypothetical protein SWH61_05190 [Thermodesulfobacteriota bacterium]|nr:hypothetical protein [Thermodesulfobacteriota bacterium]